MADSNKRIAKNTIFLYFRMLLVMAISIYTSRVVLDELGVDNYGIYNVIGGVVVLFSFFKSSLTTAIQRYFNHAMGKNDSLKLKELFSTSFIVLLSGSLIIVLLLESAGLWFINNKLNFPSDSLFTANCLYQISIVTLVIHIFQSPYDSLILANEKMSFYAYISIIEIILKLAIAYLLSVCYGQKLIYYGLFVLGVAVITYLIKYIYCIKQFNLHIQRNWTLSSYKDIASFSWWNIFGSLADVGYQQGTSMILNIFFGVTLNATIGIVNQVKSAVFSFVRNILVAANPQIYQSFSSNQTERFAQLVMTISKATFFMFLIISLPILYNINDILSIWLVNIPPYCGIFCILTLIFCMFDTLVGPLWTAAQAYGKISAYQIISSSILLLNLPGTYLCFKLHLPPYSMLVVQILVLLLSVVYRILFLYSKKLISIREYLTKVIVPSFSILFTVSITCGAINYLLHFDYTFLRIILTSIIYIALASSIIWFAGLTSTERFFIKNSILGFIRNRKIKQNIKYVNNM